jgi:DivIVA domain-containing protein
MSVYEPAAESGQDNPDGPSAFRMVWRGYDRDEVDAYLPKLTARLREAVDRSAEAEQAKAELQREVTGLREESLQRLGGEATALLQEAGRSAEQLVENARRHAKTIIEQAQQQAEQLRADGTNEAQQALKQAREVADQIHHEVEQERAALHSETEQVHEFRDGLVDDLGRVHGAISALLARTGTRRDRPLTAGGAADPPPRPHQLPRPRSHPSPGRSPSQRRPPSPSSRTLSGQGAGLSLSM